MDCIRPVIEIVTCIGTVIGILTCLWPSCVTHVNYLYKLQENGDSLERALNELRNARDDVQKKVDDAEANPNVPMKRNDQVNGWLQSVTGIEGEVLEILRQVDQQTSRRCLGGCCPDCWSDYMVGGSIFQYIASLDELRKKGDFKEVAYILPPPSVQEEPTTKTVGMESMIDKVWTLLAKDEVRIMGLYGQGGVGKTTILKHINNKFFKTISSNSRRCSSSSSSSSSLLHGFDVVILVVVSKVINIDAIQKVIGERLKLLSPNKENIFNALSKKNFVLLLDDLWEGVDLQSIGIPHPPPENNKSKVVFTTRSEAVCGLMEANEMFKVECLPWNEAWSLFQEKVGERALKSFPRARELAKDVAKECDGLPLALITIGRTMSAKRTPQEWNHAITTLRRSASEFPGMGDVVLPILKLSYDYLSDDTIKSCFLYCALFPEDHSIDIPKLIDYWIGEGFISLRDFKNIDEARNKGYDVIGSLKGACLLETGKYEEETEVKMHDTIRDLALWIAHDCESKRDKMLIINTSDLTAAQTSSSSSSSSSPRYYNNAERICLISSPNGETEEVRSPLKSPNLITLMCHSSNWVSYLNLSKLPQNFFEFTRLLRVLDLSYSRMETFPISITGLVELRYLNLSFTNIRELPEELRKLKNLNFLDLSHMGCLEKIPSGVIGVSLLELRVLNLFEARKVVDWDVIDEVYKLKHLNDLGISIYTSSSLTKLLSSSNKNLQMCTRHLLLECEDKPQSTSSSPIIILEKLKLFSNLETLRLVQFSESMNMEIEYQQHLGRSCFQNLGEISILECNGLKDLTWVGYLPNLNTLTVFGCKELEIIVVVDDYGGSTGGGDEIISSSSKMIMNTVEDIFKSLRMVRMLSLPKLKSICSHALAFPCLDFMYIHNCPELKKLPLNSGSNVNNTLRMIGGKPKWWNELQWEEEDQRKQFLRYFVDQ